MTDSTIRIKSFTWAYTGRNFLYTIVFNTAISVLCLTMGLGPTFTDLFIFSQCVGLVICSTVMLVVQLTRNKGTLVRGVSMGLSIVIGAFFGALLGATIAGLPSSRLQINNREIWQIVVTCIIFGAIITSFFYSRKRLDDTRALAQEERLKRLSSEKLALEADLKRLQAQIEPHFLFNTLSNILSLMDTDPSKAKSMQLDLIQYLRTSLGRTRSQEAVLGQEIDLIRSYLDIFKIRMGERLTYHINIPQALLQHPLPPMLLQPLVENALIHGLESKIEGGDIALSAKANGDQLKIEIADTGKGLCPQHRPGVGLTNVKKRLFQLYGQKGRLILQENHPSGVIVRLELPLSAEKNTDTHHLGQSILEERG